ncbi:MAG: hypothetical protein IJD84_01325, partial [Parabacteroides sp.]|nr:hypothetical protein [Parabacteroides sp.]
MNKKFSTLLAGAVLAMASVNVSAQTPVENTVAGSPIYFTSTASVKTTNYYQIVSDYGFLQVTKHTNGADSVKVVSSLPSATYFETLDSSLWVVSKATIAVANQVAYTLTNKATGATLQFAAKNNGTSKIAAGLDQWIASAQGLKSGKYALTIASDGTISIKESAAPSKLTLVKPGHFYMNAAALNNEGDGSSFKLAIEDLEDAENPFVKTSLKATDNVNGGVTLQAVGAKILKKDEAAYTGNAKYNANVFVAVDTTLYTATGGVDINGTDAFGYKFVADTMVAPLRNEANYRFEIYKDVTSLDGDQLIIKALGVPVKLASKVDGSYFKGATTQASYLSWAGFAAKGDELTTARIKNAAYLYSLPVITMAAGAKAEIAEGIYYVKQLKASSSDKDKYAYNYLSNATTYAGATAENAKNDLLARTQYVVTGANGRYTIVNRESGRTYVSGRIYEKDGAYFKGGSSVKFELEAVPAEVAADKHVGYKFFSKEEVGNLAVSLKFNSKIGSAYVVAPAKTEAGKEFTLEGGEDVTEEWFKVVPVDTVAFGVGMERAAYVLKSQFNNLYLNVSATDPSKLTWGSTEAGAAHVIFRSTGNEGEYQIICVTPYTASAMYKQLSVRASSAEFYLADINDAKTEYGYWTLETPAAPDYLTIEGAPAHKRIFSTENSSLAVSKSEKNAGILKGVADTDAEYVEDQFAMWIDTACMDNAEKPLYYITTLVGLDSTARAEGNAMYMMPGAFSAVAGKQVAPVQFKEGYRPGVDSLIIKNYKDGVVKSLDTATVAKSTAVFAFQITPTADAYYVENVNTGSYLRQVNGVLYLTEDKNDALLFGIESVETPTANENIAAAGVTVIAGNGQITIAGAAGKKVVIANILGQTVANTIIA